MTIDDDDLFVYIINYIAEHDEKQRITKQVKRNQQVYRNIPPAVNKAPIKPNFRIFTGRQNPIRISSKLTKH